ncbi:hypothetical protein R3W88_026907 [Solanum pinnatisectum]|uniref:Uncharacterized protein n=1 Tax=Solanum pinnatisectum TaxID=50273 RepID=A0AAV9LF86_9SOLN|nr:hypothetical protein R3W88_026907 [Solanum pinnatisectum]
MFRKFGIKLLIFENLKDYSEMTSMILFIPRIKEYVINEDDNKHVKIWLKYSLHKIHEHCRSISQTKRYNKKLIMTITAPKCCLRDATFSYSQLMIARFEIYLRKLSGTLKLTKKIINSRKRILILYSDLVQLAVIDAHSMRTIFLP